LKLFKEKKEIIQKRHNSISNYRKKTQDFSNCSCGCVFSNPEGQSAGYLIEKAGLKGRSCGNASVSLKHANFIINNGICNSNEILKLIDIVQKEVFDKFHIFLNKEVEVIE
jgi:UDP-N-acetylmuramate dehydrogenase